MKNLFDHPSFLRVESIILIVFALGLIRHDGMLRPVIFPNAIDSSVEAASVEAASVGAFSVEALSVDVTSVDAASVGVSSVEAFSAALQVLKHNWSHKRLKMCLRQDPGSGVKHENAFW
ncbi:MAG: hypothetical protein IJ714_02745 [Bacteroidales bacterium]|nr:hypothetical protein [Bacteroidales bacterium]